MAKRREYTKNQDITREVQRLRRFVEELGWLMSSYGKLDLQELESRLKSLEAVRANNVDNISHLAPENPNTRLLVGVLPAILTDTSIFRSNEDIAKFSEIALGLSVPRWEKKSKYEIIGHIVCNAGQLNESEIGGLVTALTRIVSGDTEAKRVVKYAKSANLDWNSIIQKLTQ